MTQLTVSPDQLRASARELEKLRQQHLALMKQLRILVMSLSDSWKGEAQEAFTKSFLAKNQTMNDVSTVLAQYAALMKQAADEAETMDNSLLRSVRSRLG